MFDLSKGSLREFYGADQTRDVPSHQDLDNAASPSRRCAGSDIGEGLAAALAVYIPIWMLPTQMILKEDWRYHGGVHAGPPEKRLNFS